MRTSSALLCLLSSCLAAPAPQGLELTLTSLDSSPTEDTEEPGLVLVLDSTNDQPGFGGFGGFTGRFPGLGQSFGQNLGPNFGQVFPGFGRFPSRLPPSFGFEESRPEISIDLADIFGSRPSGSDRRVPSIISALFDVLGDSLGVEGGQGGQGGQEGQEGVEYDHHNSTYDERVLADGSVVRVNRTIIQDTDDSGNTFYFSTSVHHVLDGGDGLEDVEDDEVMEGESSEEVQDPEEDEESEDGEGSEVAEGDDEGIAMVEEVGSEETSGEESAETLVPGPEDIPEYEPEAEIVPTDIDETENEVSNEKDREGKAVVPGTDSNAFIDDSLFE